MISWGGSAGRIKEMIPHLIWEAWRKETTWET